jgi:hypothetical protein
MLASRKLLSYVAFSLLLTSFASAAITSVEDGWDENDDAYATSTDTISFAQGASIDGRFVFEISGAPDTVCIAVAGGSERSGDLVVDGTTIRNLRQYEYYDLGADRYIQYTGGTQTSCRFFYWQNKDCTTDNNDAVWLTSSVDYTAAGCEPDVSATLAEGATQTYSGGWGSVEITCVEAITNKYLKCQAPTYSDLNDCMDDSFNDVGAGDDFELYEACSGNEANAQDSEYDCDIKDAASWELAFLDDDHLTALEDEIWSNGIPNATFTIYSYDFCGTGSFDRDVEGSVTLTQFQNKSRTKDGIYGYNVTGHVRGYFPWYAQSGYVDLEYVYGANVCAVGTVSTDSSETDDDNFDLDDLACVGGGGTCYDGDRNQDETETDYGGVCGNCSEDGKTNDVYWSVAIESYSTGFFGTDEPFDAETYCEEGENSTGFVVIIVMVGATLTLLFLLFVFGLFTVGIGTVVLPFIKGVLRRKTKKQEFK